MEHVVGICNLAHKLLAETLGVDGAAARVVHPQPDQRQLLLGSCRAPGLPLHGLVDHGLHLVFKESAHCLQQSSLICVVITACKILIRIFRSSGFRTR